MNTGIRLHTSSPHRRSLGAASALLITLLSACSTQAYLGPKKPDAEISRLSIGEVGDVDRQEFFVDGRPFGAWYDELEILPGSHDLRFPYRVSKNDCEKRSSFCSYDSEYGVCEGSIKTLAGRAYLLTIEEKNGVVQARLSAKSYWDFSEREDEGKPGYISCETVSSTQSVIPNPKSP